MVPTREVNDWLIAIEEYASLPAQERDRRRHHAGDVYLRWRLEKSTDHLFALVDQVISKKKRLN